MKDPHQQLPAQRRCPRQGKHHRHQGCAGAGRGRAQHRLVQKRKKERDTVKLGAREGSDDGRDGENGSVNSAGGISGEPVARSKTKNATSNRTPATSIAIGAGVQAWLPPSASPASSGRAGEDGSDHETDRGRR